MPYPEQTYPNFDALLQAINSQWITNGVGEITGVVGNNIVNGLLTFIRESPLNYQKVQIVSGGGVVVVTRPVVIFMTVTPTSVTWDENIYNQFVFLNATNAAIPTLKSYYEITDLTTPKNSIPALQDVTLFKANNNLWIRSGNNSGSSVVNPVSPIRITSADFADATHWNGQNSGNVPVLDSYKIQVFANYIPKYLEEGVDWERTSQGINILMAGFDAQSLDYEFYISLSK